jgi:hypothetical protein
MRSLVNRRRSHAARPSRLAERPFVFEAIPRALQTLHATHQAAPSGAWQKYPYRWRHGIIGAKKSPSLPQGVSYAHRHGAIPRGLPQGAADSTPTGLLGADGAPADASPAAGTACQDALSAGGGSQPVPRDAPEAPQSRDGIDMAPAMARACPQAGADGSRWGP